MNQLLSESLTQTYLINSLNEHFTVYQTDDEGFITYTNENFLSISKWTPKRVLGKSMWQMFPPTEEGRLVANEVWDTIAAGKNFFGKVEKVTRHGDPYFVLLLATPVLEDKKISHVLFTMLDITEEVDLKNKLEKIAFIDYETGLMTRYRLELKVNERIETNFHFSFVHLKFDYRLSTPIQSNNAIEGEVIKQFANRLYRFFQDSPIARVNKFEFVALTPHADWYVQGFIDFLEQQPIYFENEKVEMIVSGGIAKFPEDQQTFDRLFAAASTASDLIVKAGGNQIVALSHEQHKNINRRILIQEKLPFAIKENQLSLVFQPIIHASTQQVASHEALLRWYDPELGQVSPDELIPIAEETGLIYDIGEFTLHQVAKIAAVETKKNPAFKIAINSSVREFMKDNFSVKLQKILQHYQCPPSAIQIEITERFAFQAEEQQSIIRQMLQLQHIGISFALDDFGTGYASFRFLQTLPISIVKIDPSYTRSIHTQAKTEQLIAGIVQFCHSLELEVVAEGVENEIQFKLLRQLGIEYVQGYYISEPKNNYEQTTYRV